MSDSTPWKISIDVGGTFTDVFAEDSQGNYHTLKVLSSGITKGHVDELRGASSFIDATRTGDCDDFWAGYAIDFFDNDNQRVCSTKVARFQSSDGCMHLADEATADLANLRYEIQAPFSAAILAIRSLLRLPLSMPIPDIQLRLGTTRGTNALLTRTGCPTALVITKGFGDLLEIGEQDRPNLFELAIRKHQPLYSEVMEVHERVLFDGSLETVPDEAKIRDDLQELRSHGIRSLAICFLHGYAFPKHEKIVQRIARELGFEEVRCSSDVAPLIKIVPRGETTVLDAYLNPVLQEYMTELSSALSQGSQLRLMTSAGGLVPVNRFSGRESILSGPAGGVVGFAQVAKELGYDQAIGLDMGGTSTDVARFDGVYEKEFETFKAGVKIVSPTLAIETVAAGGGSICSFDGIRLLVGPESAGADPGPACYGRGGPLTVTDLNVFLGRLVKDQFPFHLDEAAIEKRLDELLEQLTVAGHREYDKQGLCQGLLQVANANMAAAIRTVSVASGYDPREYAMVAFGGAACQHACQIAQQLGIKKIISHPFGGILSAVGISRALATSQQVAPIGKGLENEAELETLFDSLQARAFAELVEEGIAVEQIESVRSVDIKYRGTQTPINVRGQGLTDFYQAFETRHVKEFGYKMDRPIELLAARIEATALSPTEVADLRDVRPKHPEPLASQQCFFEQHATDTPVFDRSTLEPGDRIDGPAMVFDELSCTVIDPGWTADLVGLGALVLTHQDSIDQAAIAESAAGLPQQADPVQLEVFNNYFTAIARQMGEMLRRTAVSVNVKERLDYSCAIFTADGDLVVNAPHIPVHLGAMGETVRATIELNPEMADGDVFVTNDPYCGGSHLPDVTVVSPVFDQATEKRIFFVATRCHHAEIGGLAAGSMSPDATTLEQEGVLIENFKLIDARAEYYDELASVLSNAKYPSRNVEENISDITAQVAANRRGIIELNELVNKYTLAYVLRYMEFIQAAAESKTCTALKSLQDECVSFKDQLDCGAEICVSLDKRGSQLHVDFHGTSPTIPLNLNANRAIVTAALLYCIRCLIDEDIPLNQGILNPIQLDLPHCFINPEKREPKSHSPAVAGGNVETSQRIVDVILGAWELAAASQGTMNNFICGNERFSYYETICGGTGATEGHAGVSAVHSHMTNTRLTDPEILESQFPMVLRQFSIRYGSGGRGQFNGGDGVIREIEFRDTADVTLMTNRRTTAPYGLHGGEPGTKGSNTLIRNDGSSEALDSQCQIQVNIGDRIVIETPGGGSWGEEK